MTKPPEQQEKARATLEPPQRAAMPLDRTIRPTRIPTVQMKWPLAKMTKPAETPRKESPLAERKIHLLVINFIFECINQP